ncbi:DNA sulfur modification protein DndD, partial [Escherichia coli]|nr:DNA sulfur modification protein DndD [Escherichia coli]
DGLADAMRGLLGIDVIARLRTDLGLYLARQNRAEDSESATRLDQLLARKAELDSKIAEAVEDTAELRSQRDAQSANAERVRRRFVAEGGD